MSQCNACQPRTRSSWVNPLYSGSLPQAHDLMPGATPPSPYSAQRKIEVLGHVGESAPTMREPIPIKTIGPDEMAAGHKDPSGLINDDKRSS